MAHCNLGALHRVWGPGPGLILGYQKSAGAQPPHPMDPCARPIPNHVRGTGWWRAHYRWTEAGGG
jgi:hypothetical protein